MRTVATASSWVDIPDEQFVEFLTRLRKRGYDSIADVLIARSKIADDKKQAAVDAIYTWSVETDGLGPGDEIKRLREKLIADISA